VGSKEQFFKKLMKDMPKWNEHIKGRVKEVKEHFDCLFADAEKITNQKIQALCYFSLVECFAQEFCNNSKRPTDAFWSPTCFSDSRDLLQGDENKSTSII